jgi:replicative DNA helicase
MSTATPNFITGAAAFEDWAGGLLTGTPPTVYPVGDRNWSSFEVGPGSIALLGGAPGAGKTALATQLAFEALERSPDLRVLMGNVEMSPGALYDRQLARLSGHEAADVRFRRIDQNDDALLDGMARLLHVSDRIAFLQPHFDLANLAAAGDATGAELLVIDYVQRFAPPGAGGSLRESMGAVMSALRRFADLGRALLVVSAVARARGERGSNYDAASLGLASFRESSELEYGADTAWVLAEVNGVTRLTCVKNRHGEAASIGLHFDKARQRFDVEPEWVPLAAEDGAQVRGKRPTRAQLREQAQGQGQGQRAAHEA